MPAPVQHSYRVRFSPFEFDPRAGELRKHGSVIRLQEQPFQILSMLLAHPGELVGREEIRQRLWPNDTIVEFDHSINAAIKRLRDALLDTADEPRYVETVARRGYRFIAPVEVIAPPQGAAPAVEPVTPEVLAASEPPSLEVPGEEGAREASDDLAGQTVSHYRVHERIGSGAMGVIYRAEDTRLGRTVALKFLPAELAQDRQALARFQREARAASALNHPNICTVYDIDEDAGQPFIAMELLEGETLKERLTVGAGLVPAQGRPRGGHLQIDTLLNLATQIAAGLEAAHCKGIIHRDIKPANIFLTAQGQAKILDFGIAKLTGAEVHDHEEADGIHTAPQQQTTTLTSRGTPIGTAAYMSPEQARGEVLDARTDIFSFGAVLYEMATGRLAFPGETAIEIQHAILTQQPVSPKNLVPALPPKLDEIILKALEKDRNLRFRTASDLKVDLQRMKRDAESIRVVAAGLPRHVTDGGVKPPLRQRWPILLAATMAVTAVAIAWFVWNRSRPLPEPIQIQLTINSIETPVQSGTLSPDGRYLAYSDMSGIHVKLLATGETQKIPMPEELAPTGAIWFVGDWFPDGTRFLAASIQHWGLTFGSGPRSIWAVSTMGGPPRKLRDDASGGSVSPDGSQIAFTSGMGSLGDREVWLMGANGEDTRKLFSLDEDNGMPSPDFTRMGPPRVQWSPNGQRLAYLKRHQTSDKFETTIESIDVKGGRASVILSDPLLSDFSWLPIGQIIFSRGEAGTGLTAGKTSNLWEMKVDARTGVPTSAPRRVTNWAGFKIYNLSHSADGSRLTFAKWSEQDTSLVGDLEADGTHLKQLRPLTASESMNAAQSWTADSKAVIFTSDRNGRQDIFKQTLDQESAETIVAGPGEKYDPKVSPDGSWIVYTSVSPSTPTRLMRVPVSGGPPQLVMDSPGSTAVSCSIGSDGFCLSRELTPDQKQTIFIAFDPFRGRGRELWRETKGSALGWNLSPDGSRLAIVMDEEGEHQLRIVSLREGTAHDLTVKGWSGFMYVDWAADGRALLAVAFSPRGVTLLRVDMNGNAQLLWESRSVSDGWSVTAPDGRHLAIDTQGSNSNIWMLENF